MPEVKKFNTVPNQRVIGNTVKAPCSDKKKEDYYARTNIIVMEKAMSKLSGNRFKFWMYFSKNRSGYSFALSKQDVLRVCGFSHNTYTAVFNELVKEGFLVETSRNHYDFYEVSQIPEEEIMITIHKEEGFRF